MRDLRLLRQDAEHGTLVLEEAESGDRFQLPVDDVLRAAVRFEMVMPAEPAAPPPPVVAKPVSAAPLPISPRDIQVRVRSGEKPQTIADEIGVEVERVMRFAGPVVQERGRIAGEARRARARRSETQFVGFGETVDQRYEAHGIVPTAVLWDSYRREDGEWVIVARWQGGEGEHSAEWVFHRASRTVTPIDETASDLLSDRPIRPVSRPAEPTRPALSVAPALAPGVVAFPPMPDANTGPLPVVEEVFDQESTLDEPRRIPPLAPVASYEPRATSYEPPAATYELPADPAPVTTIAPVVDIAEETGIDFAEPPLPLGLDLPEGYGMARVTNLGITRREESEDERAARARIPSWDDILLGVRPKGE